MFQEPALFPWLTAARNVELALRASGVPKAERRRRAADLLDVVHLGGFAGKRPHELSGGMRQRALIAVALAGEPRLIIADEPTSALDVTVQKGILDHLRTLARTSGTAVLLVTHDLGVAADPAARIAVMSEGVIVECAPAARLFDAPNAPYTRHLRHSAPRLDSPPIAPPPTRDRRPILEAEHLTKDFPLPRSAGGERTLRAVDDVGITVHRGETVALVGESGSGKSTTARLILRLTPPTAGRILLTARTSPTPGAPGCVRCAAASSSCTRTPTAPWTRV
jgi:peptide/nickel transport system ATP-binding protein